jgi:hypothetical protein
MSAWGQDSLSVNVSTPVVLGRSFIESLVDSVQGYTHEISAEHGFDNARIDLAVSEGEIADWLAHGLGRDITVRNAAGVEVWSGIVDVVEVREGARSVKFGPLTEIANRLAILFTEIDPTADPPTPGLRTITTYAENETSQDAYGVWELIKNGGSRTRTTANQARDAELRHRAWPERTRDLSTGGGLPSVSLTCLGYWAWLKAFTYNDAENISTTVSGKVLLVLAAEALANGVLSTEYGLIGDNDVLADRYEDDYRTGMDVITDVVKLGDENDDRWTFGVYENRQAILQVVPDTIEYVNRRGDQDVIEYRKGGEVMPWDVRPAKWLAFPDLVVGPPLPQARAAMYEDIRVEFIERVTFTAPYDLTVNGQRISTTMQALAKLGLGV